MSAVNRVVVAVGLREVDGSDCVLKRDVFDAACHGRVDIDCVLWFAIGNNDVGSLLCCR